MNIRKKYLITLISFFLIAFFIFPITAQAIDCTDWKIGGPLVQCGNKPDDPCNFEDIFCLIRQVLDYVIGTLTPLLALLWFGFAGYKMMLSQGNPSKFNEGKNMLLYGIIGIIVIFSAPIIIKSFLQLIEADDWVKFFFDD